MKNAGDGTNNQLISVGERDLYRPGAGLVSRGLSDLVRLKSASAVDELSDRNENRESARHDRRLTKAIALAFLSDKRVGLGEFTEIDDDAAVALSQITGGSLELFALTSISDIAAEALGRPKGLCLWLPALTSLSAAAAKGLAQRDGFYEIVLTGLTVLSHDAALALARHKGRLYLSGLTNLSDAAAKALSQHEGQLTLDGLASLSDTAAQALAGLRGDLVPRLAN